METAPRAWIAAMRDSHERLAALVRQLSPAQLSEPSYCREWTIAQVLSHLGSGAEIARFSIAAALVPHGTVDQGAFPAIWETWNAKSPQQQAAGYLTASEARIAALEQLSDAELDRMRLDFFGREFDAAGLLSMYLAEHAVHTWDVAVALDPAAVIPPGAVALLAGRLPTVAAWAARPTPGTFSVRLLAAGPDVSYLLEVADTVTFTALPAGDGGAAAVVALPAEALIRLVYGRLDPAHTPAGVTAEGVSLDRVRAVFPGF